MARTMSQEVIEDIRARTVPMHGGLESPVGWDSLVEALHKRLVQIHPDYKVHQIKEKFGGLRYYTDIPYATIPYNDGFEATLLISEAEGESFDICQNCGGRENVSMRYHSWVASLCDACDEAGEAGYQALRDI